MSVITRPSAGNDVKKKETDKKDKMRRRRQAQRVDLFEHLSFPSGQSSVITTSSDSVSARACEPFIFCAFCHYHY